MLGVESGRHRFLLRTVGIESVNQSLINLVKAELEQFVPSAIASGLCLFPKTEAAMALAELLLLLQVGITGAWKELATWAWGEKWKDDTRARLLVRGRRVLVALASTEDWSSAHRRKLLSHICFKRAAQKPPCHYFGGLKIKHLQVQRHYSACVGRAPHTSKESAAQHLDQARLPLHPSTTLNPLEK